MQRAGNQGGVSSQGGQVQGGGDQLAQGGQQQRMISALDIQLVQNLVERCLQLYMNQREVVSILQQQAKIEPGFTGLVWQKLEEQNPDFFKAYYARLRLKDQIVVFNQLLEQHYHLLRNLPQNSFQMQQPQYGAPMQGMPMPIGSQPQGMNQPQIYAQQQGMVGMMQPQQPMMTQQQPPQPYIGMGDPNAHVGGVVGGMSGAAPAAGVSEGFGGMGGVQGAVQPLRSLAHGDAVIPKQNSFNLTDTVGLSSMSPSPMENDGLMGGLNTFPRNFSLSDLSMDLNAQTSDGDQDPALAMLSSFQDGGDAPRLSTGDDTKGGLPRNFSISDMNLDFGGGV